MSQCVAGRHLLQLSRANPVKWHSTYNPRIVSCVPDKAAYCQLCACAKATHCDTLQHTTTQHNTLQTLQHIATHCSVSRIVICVPVQKKHTATHCNTLQHTATHCNTLQHTATHCNTLQHTAVCRVSSFVCLYKRDVAHS